MYERADCRLYDLVPCTSGLDMGVSSFEVAIALLSLLLWGPKGKPKALFGSDLRKPALQNSTRLPQLTTEGRDAVDGGVAYSCERVFVEST